MAQHDGVIDNGTGNAVRTDINNALAAINSNNSGASDPSTTYAYQFYADTGDNTFKIRNAANDGFINISITGGLGTENFGLAPLSGGTFTGTVKLNDNVKAIFGTGDDLEIFHDGTHSRIKDVGTGNLFISGTNTQLINAAGSETIAKFTEDGPVELYHNGTKTFETTASGFSAIGGTFTGDVKLNDNVKAVFGTGDDLEIYHDGTDSYLDNPTGITRIRNTGTNGSQIQLLNNNQGIKIQGKTAEQSITAIANGAVELYHDNAKKAETTSTGFTVTGTCTATEFSGSGASLTSLPAGQLTGALPAIDGSNLTGIAAGGVGGNQGIDFNDDIAIRFGTGNDISLDFDSGQNAFIVHCSNAADIILDADDDLILRSDDEIQFQTDGTTTQAFFSSAGLELVDNNTGLGEDGSTTNVIKFHDTDNTTASNQVIGRIDYEGSDSSGAGVVARIQGQSGNTAGGGELSFKVAPSGTTTLAEAININSLGGVNIYNNLRLTSSTARLMGVATGTGYAVLRQREAHGTNGGTFTAGADRVRILNLVEHDNDGSDYSGKEFVTLDTSTGEFTLEAGAYLIFFQAPAMDVSDHRAKITNDDGTTLITGCNAFSHATYPNMTTSYGWGRINNSSSEGYFLKHRCDTTKSSSGFGRDSNFGSELEFYAQVVIFREGAAT